ncbi:UNVERIFIED_CONTAM: hypothetical protein FKN15_076892 [Acipenser sinensis]
MPLAARFFTHCRLTMQPPRATALEDNAALGSLQASPQAPGQTTGVAGALVIQAPLPLPVDKEALHREQMLEQKLATLQRLLASTQEASESSWQSDKGPVRNNCNVGPSPTMDRKGLTSSRFSQRSGSQSDGNMFEMPAYDPQLYSWCPSQSILNRVHGC